MIYEKKRLMHYLPGLFISSPAARRSLRVSAVVLLLVLRAVLLSAQERKNLRFEHLSLQDGLSQAFVASILQDRQGFMWFGTQEGLNRFDGYEFEVFAHDSEDAGSLSQDLVKAVIEDHRGILWVGTDGGGLNRFDPKRKRFDSYRHAPGDAGSLASDRVRVILEDRQRRLWVGMDGGGLQRLDRSKARFETFSLTPGEQSDGPAASVRALMEDSAGRLWVGTDGAGLIRLDPESGGVETFRHVEGDRRSLTDDRIRCLLEDREGRIWIGTHGGGLDRLAPQSGEITHFRHDVEDPQSLAPGVVWTLLEDRQGVLWIGTDGGLLQWLPDEEGFAGFTHDPLDPFSLSHDRVLSVFEDAGGVLWVGTYRGLNKWNTASEAFTHFKSGGTSAGALSDDFVTSFAEGLDGAVWVGTYGGGLNRLDRQTGRFQVLRHDPRDPHSLSDDRVMSLSVDRAGVLWVGTFSGGLNALEPGSDRFRRYLHDPDDPASLSRNAVTRILEDSRGALWVGTYRGGLNRLDRTTGRFRRYRHDPADPASVGGDRVIALLEGTGGRLWVGTEGDGLSRFDPETETFTQFHHDPADPESLGSETAWVLEEDERGDLWIGTQGGGLSRWSAIDRRAGRARFERIGRRDGLLSDIVYGVVDDQRGDLWLTSDRGLTRLDPLARTFEHFDSSHGLQSHEFNHSAALRLHDGHLLFGGINGFNLVDPQQVGSNTHVPPVVITRVLKFNQPLQLAGTSWNARDLVLEYDDTVVAFEFTALDFAAPSKNRYQYRLEGFDDEWVESGGLRRATYTNLERGRYVFRVRASNNDGVWNEEGASLAIEVRPAPWRTPWAYSVYVLLLGIVLMVVIRIQTGMREHARALAVANVGLEKEVETRQAKEAELEAEKRKAQTYLDVAEVLMVVVDVEGRVTLINQKGLRTLGYREQDIVGGNWTRMVVPAERRRDVERYLADPGSDGYREYPVVTRQGDERIIAWHTAVLKDEGGRPAGTLSSGTDLTQIRRLREAKEMAESANRMKSQFLANMSHEIRTPMNSVLGMIELLLESDIEGRERHFAETAQRSARMLLELLNDILDSSKIEAGRLELESLELEVQPLVDDVAGMFAEKARQKGLSLLCQVAPELPRAVIGDPTRLRQILANLLGNAVKFTENGVVALRVSRTEAPAGLTGVLFEVEDTGIGLDREVCERIFRPFAQADGTTTRRFGGSGLGLSISRQLVHLMGGQIGVESHPGQGALFWFSVSLPEADPNWQPRGETTCIADGPEAARLAADLSAVRLLVAEDNRLNQEVVQAMLQTLGVQAEYARDGHEAVESASRTPFDLILMDCQMPRLDGYEATRRIRSRESSSGAARRAVIVALTASAMAGDRERCLACGMDDYMSKPFSRSQLRDLLARWSPRGVGRETPVDGRREVGRQGVDGLQDHEELGGPGAVLDESALRQLLDLGGEEGAAFLGQVAETFLDSSSSLLRELRKAVARGDGAEIVRRAHTLKSSSATLGAGRLSRLCKRLEAEGLQLSTADRFELLASLEGEYRLVEESLEERGMHRLRGACNGGKRRVKKHRVRSQDGKSETTQGARRGSGGIVEPALPERNGGRR